MNWERIKNLKVTRRQAIAGAALLGLGVATGIDTTLDHTDEPKQQVNPFAEGEEVDINQLRNRHEVLRIIKATATFPIIEINENDTDLSSLPEATKRRLSELRIKDFDMVEADLRSLAKD